MINFLKAAPVVFLIGTMVTAILYQKTLLEIWLTTAITFGTTAYHFIMRWVVEMCIRDSGYPDGEL